MDYEMRMALMNLDAPWPLYLKSEARSDGDITELRSAIEILGGERDEAATARFLVKIGRS